RGRGAGITAPLGARLETGALFKQAHVAALHVIEPRELHAGPGRWHEGGVKRGRYEARVAARAWHRRGLELRNALSRPGSLRGRKVLDGAGLAVRGGLSFLLGLVRPPAVPEDFGNAQPEREPEGPRRYCGHC
ncbi:MAG: hypothetical protein ACXU86_11835, partial [Archangium sp.]